MPTATAQRQDKIRATMDKLDRGLADLTDGDAYKEWLRASKQFHSYSFSNQILIMIAGGSRVAGFGAWKRLGRHVRKGERGITIIAPRRVPYTDDAGEKQIRLAGFGTATVFDISQTDGEPLPPHPAQNLAGMAPANAYDRLATVAAGESLTITIEPAIGGESGYYKRAAKQINLSAGDYSPADRVSTLTHELAHHFTATDCTRPDGEIIAESVAYIVADALGLDSGRYSFGYVATWASGDLSKMRTLGSSIQKTANTLLTALENGGAE